MPASQAGRRRFDPGRPLHSFLCGSTMRTTLRTETTNGVGHVVLTRAAEYNTITPALRDELAAAIDELERSDDVHVILLRAEGKAFCAGYGLDWSTTGQAREDREAEQGKRSV